MRREDKQGVADVGAVDYYYLIIDVSDSMHGNKIGAVNDAVNNMIFRLKRVKMAKDITLKVVSLTYSDEVNWSTPFPVDVTSFTYSDPTVHGKASNMGKVLDELDAKLKRQAEASVSVTTNTTIIFFTDGLMTDDWSASLEKIKNNDTFQKSNKIAVTFGDELSIDIAKENLSVLLGGEKNIVIDNFVELNRVIFEQYK